MQFEQIQEQSLLTLQEYSQKVRINAQYAQYQ